MSSKAFDIVGFLAENKLTTNSRESKVHFGKVEISRVGKKLLNEMQMKADQDDLEEAGYSDEDWDDDSDLDFSAGDSMIGKLGGDKARQAFNADKESSFDDSDDDDDGSEDFEDGDFEDSEDDGSFEDPEDLEDGPGESKGSELVSQLHYDPEVVEFEMDDTELGEYLEGFRRPQVAVKVLQRAINQAGKELEDSPGIGKMFLVLDNGFYKTSVFRKGNVIATIRKKKK